MHAIGYCVQVSAMSCGLLPLCYDAMALGEVPFCDVDGDQQQLTAAIGSSSKVSLVRSALMQHRCTQKMLCSIKS